MMQTMFFLSHKKFLLDICSGWDLPLWSRPVQQWGPYSWGKTFFSSKRARKKNNEDPIPEVKDLKKSLTIIMQPWKRPPSMILIHLLFSLIGFCRTWNFSRFQQQRRLPPVQQVTLQAPSSQFFSLSFSKSELCSFWMHSNFNFHFPLGKDLFFFCKYFHLKFVSIFCHCE